MKGILNNKGTEKTGGGSEILSHVGNVSFERKCGNRCGPEESTLRDLT